VVRTETDPAALMPTVGSLVGGVNRAAAVDAMLPMDELVASSLTRLHFYALILLQLIFRRGLVLAGARPTHGVAPIADEQERDRDLRAE
jgi:hypothetical protein